MRQLRYPSTNAVIPRTHLDARELLRLSCRGNAKTNSSLLKHANKGNQKILRQVLIDYGMISLAGVLYAIALKYFVLPSRVILTGTEGIATALSYYFENYYLFIALYLAFQSVLLVFAYFHVGKVFAIRSIVVVATVVIVLAIMPQLQFAQPESQNERIILVLFGGILAGVAKALAFTHRGSTGDEDIVGAYIAMKYLKPVGAVAIFAGVASTAFGMSMDYLKNGNFEAVINTLMYTSIYIFVSAETLNNSYHKFKIMMLAVVTKKQQQIGAAITSASEHRTYTAHQGVGGRSTEPFTIVRTIITHEELHQMIETVTQADPDCFYYYHDIEGVSRRYYIAPIG